MRRREFIRLLVRGRGVGRSRRAGASGLARHHGAMLKAARGPKTASNYSALRRTGADCGALDMTSSGDYWMCSDNCSRNLGRRKQGSRS
jgi:hypothetical protein